MTEIFRHYRPKLKERNLDKGGLSFLMRPEALGIYSYWIYICPLDTEFSMKQATKSLRERAVNGTKPWGTIELTEDISLLDLLISDVNKLSHDLPSETPDIIKKILAANLELTNK